MKNTNWEKIKNNLKKDLEKLNKEYKKLTKDLNDYPNSCYEQDNYDRRLEVVKRIKKLKSLIK